MTLAAARSGERILVIKLSALGDFVLAFGPFAAIRTHHPDAHVTLLTTRPYAELARRSPWFDEVQEDGRPAWTDVPGLVGLAHRLRTAGFTRVYDLQTSGRSSRYRLLAGRRTDWSGIARGASHAHVNPARDLMHTLERQREQLIQAGISRFPTPEHAWIDADLSRLDLPSRYALLVPGASPGRPAKRWPHFPALAALLPLPLVVVGTAGEAALAADIRASRPDTVDLSGRTSLLELGALARRAVLAVGNDTGPVHFAAAVGCPTLALFGADSDPHITAPRGERARVLHRVPLSALAAEEVLAELLEMDALPASA